MSHAPFPSTEGCARLVADAVDAVTGADVIVLAQGATAPAQRLPATPIPVLSSPRPRARGRCTPGE
ncbi:hypothetical protein OG407_43420 [Streptomyces sp. NBC_01515]|uniref:hypothetical protein n=1 Tax=Streptomyces sp. NBC_01515 TaxID=2903890 RepID=UPI0038660A81